MTEAAKHTPERTMSIIHEQYEATLRENFRLQQQLHEARELIEELTGALETAVASMNAMRSDEHRLGRHAIRTARIALAAAKS